MTVKKLILPVIVLFAVLTVAFLGAPVAQAENTPQIEENAPSFSVKTLEGQNISLGDYRGKILILDFFTSWCHVCKNTTPELARVRDNFSRENLAILSIASDPETSMENVRSFKSEYGGDWLFARPPDVADKYGVEAYPTIFVVDSKGQIAFASKGAVRPKVLSGIVRDVLSGDLPEGPSENRGTAGPILKVDVRPENGGGVTSVVLKVTEEGKPYFKYTVKANPGYKFEGWTGEGVPEGQRDSETVRIFSIPGTDITANFVSTGAPRPSPPVELVPVAIIAGLAGVFVGYVVWGYGRDGENS